MPYFFAMCPRTRRSLAFGSMEWVFLPPGARLPVLLSIPEGGDGRAFEMLGGGVVGVVGAFVEPALAG